MSVSIIDGHVEAADLKRARGGTSVFRSLTFQPDSGETRTIKNAVVMDNVAAELTPGARGRFYLYATFDLKGVHGVRTVDGRALFAYPGGNNRKIFLTAAIVAAVWIVIMVATRGAVPLLAVAGLILGVVGYIFMGKGARETKAQFDGDSGYSPPPAF